MLVAVPPYIELARSLGGDLVEVTALLESGESHESFAPTPSRVLGWHRADLYWSVGLDFEKQWLPKLRTVAPDLRVIDPPEPARRHGKTAHDAHAHHHEDRHSWLDPKSVAVEAEAFVQSLVRLRPAREAQLRANLAAFQSRCRKLDEAIADRLVAYRGSRIYVYHGAFDYFAEAYGLEQVALQVGARPPSVRELAELIRKAREDGATAVFVQPQESPAAARKLAQAIGAELVTIDPLAVDWENNLRAIAKKLEADFARRSPQP